MHRGRASEQLMFSILLIVLLMIDCYVKVLPLAVRAKHFTTSQDEILRLRENHDNRNSAQVCSCLQVAICIVRAIEWKETIM